MTEKHMFGTKNLSTGVSFIGRIISAEWTVSKDFGKGQKEQLKIEVKPLSFESKNWVLYFRYSDRINSKWGKLNEMIEKSGIPFDPNTFTEEDLINKVFEFKSFNLDFGGGKDIQVAQNVLLPVRYIPEELVQAEIISNEEHGTIEDIIAPKQELPPKPEVPPTEQETEPYNEDLGIQDLIASFIKMKKSTSIKEILATLNIKKDVLLPALFSMSASKLITLEGDVVTYKAK